MAKFRLKKGKKYHGFKDGKRHKYTEGEIIDTDPDRLKYSMDIFDALDPIEVENGSTAAPRTQLKAVYREDGKYDVINVIVEVPINDVPLTKKEARALVDGENLVALDKEEIKEPIKEEIKEPIKEEIKEPVKEEIKEPIKKEKVKKAVKEEKPDGKGTNSKDLAKGNRVYTRRRTKSK